MHAIPYVIATAAATSAFIMESPSDSSTVPLATISPLEDNNNNTIILVSSIASGLLLLLVLLLLFIFVLICLSVVGKRKLNRGIILNFAELFQIIILLLFIFGDADVIDHVPVDDNPTYITMKRITLNKNSAYETVNIAASHYETVNDYK